MVKPSKVLGGRRRRGRGLKLQVVKRKVPQRAIDMVRPGGKRRHGRRGGSGLGDKLKGLAKKGVAKVKDAANKALMKAIVGSPSPRARPAEQEEKQPSAESRAAMAAQEEVRSRERKMETIQRFMRTHGAFKGSSNYDGRPVPEGWEEARSAGDIDRQFQIADRALLADAMNRGKEQRGGAARLPRYPYIAY